MHKLILRSQPPHDSDSATFRYPALYAFRSDDMNTARTLTSMLGVGRLLTALVLTAALGCGGDATGPSGAVGTWRLSTVNGAALPYVVTSGASKFEVLADALNLQSDGTFTRLGTNRITLGSTSSTLPSNDNGVYTRSGGTIALTTAGTVAALTGTVTATTLTLNYANGNGTWQYTR